MRTATEHEVKGLRHVSLTGRVTGQTVYGTPACLINQSQVSASCLNTPDKRQNASTALDQPFGTLLDS